MVVGVVVVATVGFVVGLVGSVSFVGGWVGVITVVVAGKRV